MKEVSREEYSQYTIGLALFDAVPVLFFLMSGMIIYSMYGSRVFMLGVLACVIGGSAKVLWKLLIVLTGKDRKLLTLMFNRLMLSGFALMLIAVIISAVKDAAIGIPPGCMGTLNGLWQGLTLMPATLFFAAGCAGMCLMGYFGSHMDSGARSNWIEEVTNALAQLAFLIGVVIVYFGLYYHADAAAFKSLESTADVSVAEIEEGYYFDGSGTDSAIVFYPGAKVEAEAYAPLMQQIAEAGIDCYLCRMPLNMAIMGKDTGSDIREKYESGQPGYISGEAGNAAVQPDNGSMQDDSSTEQVSSDSGIQTNNYKHWYLAGHSLGGVAASMLASESEEQGTSDGKWSGIIYLASYPTDEIDMPALLIYGSEDEVLNLDALEEAKAKGYFGDQTEEYVIEGGNHAGFGSYGFQKGDGEADISQDEQIEDTADHIATFCIGD